MKRDDVLSCPICGRGAILRFRPFCSSRCADIDLHRWLSGSYAVPAVERELGADDLEQPEAGGERAAGHDGP